MEKTCQTSCACLHVAPHLVRVLHPLVVLHRVSVDEGLGEVDVGFAERGLVQCALVKVISCTDTSTNDNQLGLTSDSASPST